MCTRVYSVYIVCMFTAHFALMLKHHPQLVVPPNIFPLPINRPCTVRCDALAMYASYTGGHNMHAYYESAFIWNK